MTYSTIRLKLSLLKKIVNVAIVICMFLILGMVKPSEVSDQVKLIAKPILKPFFEHFQKTGRNYTNIFNL